MQRSVLSTLLFPLLLPLPSPLLPPPPLLPLLTVPTVATVLAPSPLPISPVSSSRSLSLNAAFVLLGRRLPFGPLLLLPLLLLLLLLSIVRGSEQAFGRWWPRCDAGSGHHPLFHHLLRSRQIVLAGPDSGVRRFPPGDDGGMRRIHLVPFAPHGLNDNICFKTTTATATATVVVPTAIAGHAVSVIHSAMSGSVARRGYGPRIFRHELPGPLPGLVMLRPSSRLGRWVHEGRHRGGGWPVGEPWACTSAIVAAVTATATAIPTAR
mmetsp:Transcript_36983/g.85425  ORF Transcript_36983/g.85425 Transcript_36983/m.85425 type:complete len:266 (-) Transcript_36983:33-830(-)